MVLNDTVTGNVNETNTVNRTMVGQRAFLQVYDPSYFVIVYTSKNSPTDAHTQLNYRYVNYFNETKLRRNEFNVAQFNST